MHPPRTKVVHEDDSHRVSLVDTGAEIKVCYQHKTGPVCSGFAQSIEHADLSYWLSQSPQAPRTAAEGRPRILVEIEAQDADGRVWSAGLPNSLGMPREYQGLLAVDHPDPAEALRALADLIDEIARCKVGEELAGYQRGDLGQPPATVSPIVAHSPDGLVAPLGGGPIAGWALRPEGETFDVDPELLAKRDQVLADLAAEAEIPPALVEPEQPDDLDDDPAF